MAENEHELMTREEVAETLRVSVRSLADLRRRHPLACYRFGRAVRFRRADVEAWVEAFREGEARRPSAVATLRSSGTGGARRRRAAGATTWDEAVAARVANG